MEVRINAIHFEITSQLTEFINRKADKVARRNPAITYIDFNLRVVKPETAMNKEVVVKVIIPHQNEIVAKKVADSFEEAIDTALEAVEQQLEKIKAQK